MSGPYCETCTYYHEWPIAAKSGECVDPAKPIFLAGTQVTLPPAVNAKNHCNNYKAQNNG